ncbi:MAG: glycosyltransferase family 1 protein [Alloacidobacterium sp.]
MKQGCSAMHVGLGVLRRPRIGVDLHILEGIHQGSRTHCIELFSRLPELLPEADIFFLGDVPHWDTGLADRFARPNTWMVAMPHTNSITRLLRQLPALADELNLDYLHTQYIAPPRIKCRTVVTIHDILFETHPQFFLRFFRWRSRMFVRASAKRSALLFTVSEYSRQSIATIYKVSLDKITTTYNAANRERFHPAVEDVSGVLAKYSLTQQGYLLCVGRLEPRKNHVRLVQAFAQIAAEERSKLVIVGQRDFGFEGTLEAIRNSGCTEDIQILEHVSDAELPVLYKNAYALAYPTLAEGFGMPVIEAMACGTPVLTSSTTSLPEIAGDAALCVDPQSVEEICRALEALIRDPTLRQRLSKKSVRQANTFDWQVEAEKLASAYRRSFAEARLVQDNLTCGK